MTEVVVFHLARHYTSPDLDLYEAIKSGKKKVEWRQAKSFWFRRLCQKYLVRMEKVKRHGIVFARRKDLKLDKVLVAGGCTSMDLTEWLKGEEGLVCCGLSKEQLAKAGSRHNNAQVISKGRKTGNLL